MSEFNRSLFFRRGKGYTEFVATGITRPKDGLRAWRIQARAGARLDREHAGVWMKIMPELKVRKRVGGEFEGGLQAPAVRDGRQHVADRAFAATCRQTS